MVVVMKHLKSLLNAEWVRVVSLSLLLLVIGMFYSGKLFLTHFTDGIAVGAVHPHVEYMLPGDHHEQFYRYSLFKTNIERGYPPYFSGYLFASGVEGGTFSEGLIFFPFTAISGVMAFVLGDIPSYNLLLLFSYVFVGLAGYFMAIQLTGSRPAGVVVAVFLATVPFRTSFLYGEMIFGVDTVMLPLFINFIEKGRSEGKSVWFALVGITLFLTITANFQLFYWAMFILWPYLVYRLVGFLCDNARPLCVRIRSLAWLLPGLIACAYYTVFIYSMMKGSALHGGQDFNETLLYTPELNRMFIRFNGNEKNVYLGLTTLFVMPWLLLPLFRSTAQRSRPFELPMFFALWLFSYALCFGPIIDHGLKLPVYQWLFDHVPGFNGTRTPGRIMAVVVVLYAILLGYFVSQVTGWFSRKKWKYVPAIFAAACLVVIVADFNYLRPGINTFMQGNKAYESIRGKQAKVVALPFQLVSANYLNSTFLPLALKYDLRMFSGHSSVYPRALDDQVRDLYSLNDGKISESQWKWLLDNKYEYILSHYTQFEPRVNRGTLAGLCVSPFVDFVMQDDGVYLYKIRETRNDSVAVGESALIDAYERLPDIADGYSQAGIDFLPGGWYIREVPTGQKPFRWMYKTDSSFIMPIKRSDQIKRIRFDYLCPSGTSLEISAKLVRSTLRVKHLPDGWEQMDIELSSPQKKFVIINFKASQEFRAPPDSRIFGCQVGDIIVDHP